MAKTTSLKVCKLTDENFEKWDLQLKVVLKAAGVWGFVSGDNLQAEAEFGDDWIQSDSEAQAVIVTSLSEAQMNHVYGLDTSKAMYDKLKSVHSDSSISNQQHTLTRFLNYKFQRGTTLVNLYTEVQGLAQSLTKMGMAIDDKITISKILSSLPAEYIAFKKAWKTGVKEADQTMDYLLTCLKSEQLDETTAHPIKDKQNVAYIAANKNGNWNSRNQQGPSAAQGQASSRKIQCFRCGKFNHIQRHCRTPERFCKPPVRPQNQRGENGFRPQQLQQQQQQQTRQDQPRYQNRNQNQQQNEPVAYALTEENDETSRIWYSDSGASSHVTGHKDWFKVFESMEEDEHPLYMTNKGKLCARGKGTVELEALVGNDWKKVTIHDVLYVPKAVNLFSEGKMAQLGFVITRNASEAVYDLNGKGGPKAIYKNGVYEMLFRPVPKHSLATIQKKNLSKLWHNRLCHINLKSIQDSVKSNAVTGIKLDEIQDETIFCEPCEEGKARRQPYPTSEDRIKYKPGELIHADLAGRFPVSSLGGSNYYLLMKDDATGFRGIEFLKTKDETQALLIKFLNFMENQTGNKVKALRTDGGTEFKSKELDEFLSNKGIVHQLSPPYSPQSNGRIEKEMLTIKDTARAMMQANKVPEFLWAEAAAFSVYIHNRMLDKQSPVITAYEQVFKKRPHLGHVRIFGSVGYYRVPDHSRKVWGAKGKKCILVGYSPYTHHYRVYDATTRKVHVVHDVKFHEQVQEDNLIDIVYESEADEHQDHEPEEPVAAANATTMEDNEEQSAPEAEPDQEVDHESDPEEKEEPEDTEAEETPHATKQPRVRLLFKYKDGMYTAEVPPGTPATVKIDKKVAEIKQKRETLRDRTKIKAPDFYRPGSSFVCLPETPETYEQAINSPEAQSWMEAMKDEMKSHETNGTWELTSKPEGAHVLNNRWVYRVKTNPDGSIQKYKARLVAKGYAQIPGIDFNETFSSVVRYESIRVMFAVAAAKNLKYKSFDIHTAYLYGTLDETIFMTQPEGFQVSDQICLLRKSLYGLKQSGRMWNQKFTAFLKRYDLTPTHADPCIFIGKLNDFSIYLLLFVDDGLLFSENEDAIDIILAEIKQDFKVQVSPCNIYVGIQILNRPDGILLHQTKYIDSILKRFQMEDCKSIGIPMPPNTQLVPAEVMDSKLEYQQLIGSLIFLAKCTRPDVTYAVSKLSQFMSAFGEEHMMAAKRVLRYLRATPNLGIWYPKSQQVILQAYSDSDFAGDITTRKSTSGFICNINDSPVTWMSQKQPIVAQSTMESEYIALSLCAREVVWLRGLLEEIGMKQDEPTKIHIDNQSAIRLAYNPEMHKRSKHIQVRFHYVREQIENKEVELEFVPTLEQKADGLTKPLDKTKHTNMKTMLNMRSICEGIVKASSYFFAPKSISMIFLLCLLCVSVAGVMPRSDSPVLWRASKESVISGYYKSHVIIKMISTCDFLTDEIIHPDLLQATKSKCDEIYESMFLNELENMCEVETVTNLLNRPKRAIITMSILGTIALVQMIGVGLGVAGFAKSVKNSDTLTEHQERLELQQEKIADLDQKLANIEETVKKLQIKFKHLLIEHGDLQKDFSTMKNTYVSSTYAIAYITTRMTQARQVLQEARRHWIRGKVYPPLLDFFEIKLPCGDTCPLHLAQSTKCYMSHDRKSLTLDFGSPTINTNLVLLTADPFILLSRKKQDTCRVEYTGPRNVIMSTTQDCIYAVNVEKHFLQDMIVVPKQGCMPKMNGNDNNNHFSVTSCEPYQEHDEWKFVQIKPFNNDFYIYCYGTNITIGPNTMVCPDYVYTLPIGAEFWINDISFSSSQFDLNKQETLDPIFTLKTNQILQPHVDEKLFDEEDDNDDEENAMPSQGKKAIWLLIPIFIIMIILCIGIGIVIWKQYVTTGIQVVAHPLETLDGADDEI